jgi:hypothetical protein
MNTTYTPIGTVATKTRSPASAGDSRPLSSLESVVPLDTVHFLRILDWATVAI